MKTNYVLIDYENVQPAAITALDHEYFKVIVFVGANQTKIAFEFAALLQQMGPRAQYVKIASSGPNALDFHIAFYIGRLAAQEPSAYFHVISKDTGFDSLIQHLRDQKILAFRSIDIAEIPIVKAASAETAAQKLALIASNLKRQGEARPRTVKTLSTSINILFQNRLSEADLTALVQALQQEGLISVEENKVSYTLPA